MIFKKYVGLFLGNFNKYDKRKYIIGDSAFTRKGKAPFMTVNKMILASHKKTGDNEAKYFSKALLEGVDVKITNSGVSERKTFISPQIFIDMNNDFLNDIYINNSDEMVKFKGYTVAAIDGSIIDIPNTKITRDEFEIPDSDEFQNYTATARASCMVDVNMNFILSSNLTYRDVSEISHAMMHLDDVKSRFDISKFITIYDRGYNSHKIIIKHELLGAPFILRGKIDFLKKQQNSMSTDDETFEISLSDSKIEDLEYDDLKEFMKKNNGLYKVRIVKVKLNNGKTEILFTNLPKEVASKEELKELYGQRWSIETNFDKLKNKIKIEQFSGRRKITIEQDFYSHILFANLVLALQHDAKEMINIEQRKNNKHKYELNPNFNHIVGEMKSNLPRLFNASDEELPFIVEEIVQDASKHIVYTKKDSPSNSERSDKAYKETKCPSNIRDAY